MAFSSTIVETKHLSPGNLQRIDGTWNAAAVTAGEIDLDTYISTIYMAGVNCLTGTGVTRWGMNVESDMATVNEAMLSIGACTAGDTGQFWAVGPIV